LVAFTRQDSGNEDESGFEENAQGGIDGISQLSGHASAAQLEDPHSIFQPDNDIKVMACIAIYSHFAPIQPEISRNMDKYYRTNWGHLPYSTKQKIIETYIMNSIYNCYTKLTLTMPPLKTRDLLQKILNHEIQTPQITGYLIYDDSILEHQQSSLTPEESEIVRQLKAIEQRNPNPYLKNTQ
jgi:hypothetical protein